MIKKILCMLFGLFFVDAVYAAQIVNVEYIHNLIESKWSVRIPYHAELDNPAVAANMQYLLTSVDIANQMVNGGRISDYGTGEFESYGTCEFATSAAADTIVANTAIENYVQSIDWRFSATATKSTVSFDISAAGTFYVNWGDGIIERIVRPVAVNETYSHTYASAGNHTIRFGGRANGYISDAETSAISFRSQKWLGGIDGCLGTVENNLAYIDFTKCKLCKKCVAECPTGAIHAVNFPVVKPKPEAAPAPKPAEAPAAETVKKEE